MKIKVTTFLVIFLATAEVLLALLSWVLSSTTLMTIRSLLSTEGIRWFLGHYNDILLTPLLVWILLFSMAYGVFSESRLLKHSDSYRERMGYRTACIVLLLYVVFILLLVAVPHAILLSATGSVFPSPFSRALFPLISFGVLLTGMVYGVIARVFVRFSDVVSAALTGIYRGAPILLLYILFMQLYDSLRFVFA